jgi:hypothetical protein
VTSLRAVPCSGNLKVRARERHESVRLGQPDNVDERLPPPRVVLEAFLGDGEVKAAAGLIDLVAVADPVDAAEVPELLG